jgi:hypothetical protein
MASSTTAPSGAGEVAGAAGQQQQGTSQVGAAASAPVELSDLSTRQPAQSSTQEQSLSPSIEEKFPAQPQADNQIQSSATQTSFAEDAPALVTRKETEAIGPATDGPTIQLDPSAGPAVMITLLLPTGARHPFKIDEKYLKRRNVTVEDMNPLNISVYTMKELIWRDWREGRIPFRLQQLTIANSIYRMGAAADFTELHPSHLLRVNA